MPIAPDFDPNSDEVTRQTGGGSGGTGANGDTVAINQVAGNDGTRPNDNTILTLNNGGVIDTAAPAGTIQSDVNYEFRITSNVAGASILVDGILNS